MNGSGTRYCLAFNWMVNHKLSLKITIHGNGSQSQDIFNILNLLSEIYQYGTEFVAERVKVRVYNQGTDAARIQDLFERTFGIPLIITLDWKYINALNYSNLKDLFENSTIMDNTNYVEYDLDSALYKFTSTNRDGDIDIIIEIEKYIASDPDIVNFLTLERLIYITIREWISNCKSLSVYVRNCGIDDVWRLQDSLSELCDIKLVLIKQEWRYILA